MASDTNVGYASLQVIPTIRGVGNELTRAIGGPLQAAGQAAGRQAGQSIADGIANAEGRVRQSSDKLARARDAETAAAAKVAIEEAKLQELRERGITGGSRWLAQSERLRQAQGRQAQAARGTETATEALTRAQRELDDANNATEESTSSAGGALAGLGGKAKEALGNLKGLALVGGTIGGTITAGIAGAMSKEVLTDKLAASLGATPAMAKQYGDTASRIYAGAWGDSLEQVTDSVGVVASSFKNLGTEGEVSLEKATTRALDFSTVFGTEVSESVQTVSTLMSTGLVSSTTQGFDLMTAAFQRVPAAMRDELPEILHEYGVNFNALGFTGEQAFSTLVQAAQKGKFALDKTGDALKEFTIRGSDMSEASQGAYTAIGLDAEEMSRKIAAGGAGAQEALQATARGLLGISDPATRANTAIALFGTPLEDLSVDQIPAFLEGLTGGENAMAGFAGATDRMGQTVNDNGTVKLEALKRSITGGFTTALGESALWLSKNVPLLKDLGIAAGLTAAALGALALQQSILAAGGIAAWFSRMIGLTKAWAASQTILNLVMNANPLGIVIIAVTALVAAIVLAYRNSETFRNIVSAAWNGIKVAIGAVWSWLSTTVWPGLQAAFRAVGAVAMWLWQNAILPAWNGIKFAIEVVWFAIQVYFKLWQIAFRALGAVATWLYQNAILPAWNGIQTAIGFAWGVISPIFNLFKAGIDVIGNVVNWLWNEVMVPAWNGIKSAIEVVWNFIRPILDNIGKGIQAVGTIATKVGDSMRNAFNGVVDVLKVPIHAVGKLLASVPDKVLGISVPGAGAINAWGETLQSLRTGGMIDAQPGGFVVNAKASRQYAPLLSRLGGQKIQGPGSGTSDSILAKDDQGRPLANVSNGEFYFPPGMALPILGFLKLLNEGDYDGSMSALGVEEDSPVVDMLLRSRRAILGLAGGGSIGEPYGLPTGTNISYGGSGFPGWVTKLGAEHNVKPSTYAGHQESDRGEAGYAPNPSHLNRGIDWSGDVGAMQKFAEWLLSIAPSTDALEQIIWMNPGTGQKIGWHGRSQDDGSYFASDYGGHTDHVHTRQAAAFGGAAIIPKVPDTSTATPEYQSPDLNADPTGDGTTSPGATTESPKGGGEVEKKTRMKSFKELGSDLGGILAEGVGETLGLPSWIMDPQGYVDSNSDDGSNVRTSDDSGNKSTTSKDGANAGNRGIDGSGPAPLDPSKQLDVPEPVKPDAAGPGGRKGQDLYAYQIAKAGLDAGVGKLGAKIGEATALVESGNPLKMWANKAVPASLNFPHDAVGTDYDSVGLFQQRDNGAWGTVADRMDPYRSAGMFYKALKAVPGWESMDPGAAAQAVQRSAFPDKYAGQMSAAEALLARTGLFDTGGVFEPGTLAYNDLNEPELVLKKYQWGVMDRNARVVEAQARQGGGGDGRIADTLIVQGYTAEEVAQQWRRQQWERTAGYGSSRNR